LLLVVESGAKRELQEVVRAVLSDEHVVEQLADLFEEPLARQRLLRCGVTGIDGGGFCTRTDEARFFSYRRERESAHAQRIFATGQGERLMREILRFISAP
jgi:copper oxidase (laccase) domain-containing protein